MRLENFYTILQALKCMNQIEIIEYRPEHQPYFEQFNRDWIEKYFWLEEIDIYVLQNPEEAILAKGGSILMATCDGTVAGTVALKKVNEEVYEFTKMAVDESFRRRGIAEKLSFAAFEKAKELGANKVILYSQTGLVPAITMYKKLGFKEVPIESGIYKRSDIKMEIELTAITI
jgi:GNAT superfamily N-acetyltransferase